MYCQSCGTALTRKMKYCNHCGIKLQLEEGPDIVKPDQRLDEYVEGLFWTTAFGLGFILGGMVVMKGIGLNTPLIIAYLSLSSTAFLIIFGIHLWQIIQMTLNRAKANKNAGEAQFDTDQLTEARPQVSLGEAASITEDTTRSFETTPTEIINR